MKYSTRIKVLHVAPLPPPLGGMVTYIQGLLNSSLAEQVDARVVRFDFLGKERFSGIMRVVINFVNAIILTVVFIHQVLFWQPDIVHIQTNSGFGFYEKSWIALLAKLFRCKTLMHVHGGNFREFYTMSPRIMQRIILWCARINDRIVTASPQMRSTWLYIGLPDEKITLIGNAVNLPVLEHACGASKIFKILFLTRIVFAKGIIELIDAVCLLHKSYDHIQLRIVGAEELETPKIKNYLNALDATEYIQYVGPVSELQKHNEYINADVFAFPTHVEDQSYAVMEAMSYGLACIASNVGGVPSLIQDGQNGLLIPPKDVDALTSALEKLARDLELCRELGTAARKTIEDGFGWTRRAVEMSEFYRTVLGGKAAK